MTTDDWRNAILLYELTCEGEGQARRTIQTRLCSVRSMARKLGTAGPAEVTKNAMVAYLAAEVRRRKGAGKATHFADFKSFWSWWAKENVAVTPWGHRQRPTPSRLTPMS